MRRLGRYIFKMVVTLSLLLCLASVVLWVRAGERSDRLSYHSRRALYMLIASRVGVEYYRGEDDLDHPPAWAMGASSAWSEGWYHIRDFFGDGKSAFVYEDGEHGLGFTIGLPYWLICLVTSITPAAWMTARLCRRRHRPGLCPKCHYDLRATPSRCPECGTVVADATKVPSQRQRTPRKAVVHGR